MKPIVIYETGPVHMVQRYNLGPMNYVPVVRSVEGSLELIAKLLEMSGNR